MPFTFSIFMNSFFIIKFSSSLWSINTVNVFPSNQYCLNFTASLIAMHSRCTAFLFFCALLKFLEKYVTGFSDSSFCNSFRITLVPSALPILQIFIATFQLDLASRIFMTNKIFRAISMTKLKKGLFRTL